MKKTFYYKIEDLPVIGEFLLDSLTRDIEDFNDFSSMFTADFLRAIGVKINSCKGFISSSVITKELKKVTQDLYYKSNILRLKLNMLEGYFKLGANDLDIQIENVGFKSVRNNITRHNTKGVLSNMQMIMTIVKRNQSVLTEKGLKPKIIKEIEMQIHEINELNMIQNEMITKRNKLTEKNIGMFNDLWTSLQPVLKTAKAIYRSVDEDKLKDYTVSQLVKRINAKKIC
ncbi:MAG: hypothetical protein LBG80_10385 [Bacteroidales bacterium]|jgi:hypothetical protein|nr:hypothetical protein [Bacteroidales bacterium]